MNPIIVNCIIHYFHKKNCIHFRSAWGHQNKKKMSETENREKEKKNQYHKVIDLPIFMKCVIMV